jgi:hypothetical protein
MLAGFVLSYPGGPKRTILDRLENFSTVLCFEDTTKPIADRLC